MIVLYIAPICLLVSLACCCKYFCLVYCILSVFLLGSTTIELPLCNPFLLDKIISIQFKGFGLGFGFGLGLGLGQGTGNALAVFFSSGLISVVNTLVR